MNAVWMVVVIGLIVLSSIAFVVTWIRDTDYTSDDDHWSAR